MPTVQDLILPMRRETDLSKISGKLSDLADARFDLVADQSALSIDDDLGAVRLVTGEPQLTDSGVTQDDFTAEFTRTAWRQIAERLRIPVPYLDRLASVESNQELAAHSINWLADGDDRRALYRFLRDETGELVLRSVLSDRFGLFDNDVALQALLEGLTSNGLGLGDCEVSGDVTPDRLRLRITVPQIELAIPDLLDGYKMPFSMKEGNPMHARPDAGETPPVMWAGIEIANSETGHGAFTVSDRAVIAVCRNGMTRNVEFRKAHIGSTLEDGAVDWSDDTRQNVYRLCASQVSDVARSMLSTEHLTDVANEMRAAKGIEVEDSTSAVEIVTQRFGLSESESRNVFDCFARGGDFTALGVGQAVTAAAQLVEDGDRQTEMEQMFWGIVETPQAFATV